MNNDEAKRFFQECAFVSFPSIMTWLHETSPNPKLTLNVWSKALEKITLEEANEVIKIWALGLDPKNKAPEAYQRDQFHLHIKSCALDRRAVRNAKQAAADERAQTKPQTFPAMAYVRGFSIWMEHWLPLQKKVESLEMSREDALAKWNAHIDSEFQKANHGGNHAEAESTAATVAAS
jgi:hypothetical protein